MSLRLSLIAAAAATVLGLGAAYAHESGTESARPLVMLPTAAATPAKGGGGATSATAAAMTMLFSPSCATTVAANSPFSCQLTTSLSGPVTWTLAGAPDGMVIQPKSGWVHWTPQTGQVASYTIHATATATGGGTDSQSFALSATSGAANPSGVYVSTTGSDGNSGSAGSPFKTIDKAVKTATAGQTIYIRGGTYGKKNASDKDVAKFTTSGTSGNPITIRNFGNEYVKLVSDRNGLNIGPGVSYINVEGLEIEGPNQALDIGTALANWWIETDGMISGRGITSRGDHINIEDCIIHDFPAGGIVSNDAQFFDLRDSIVYNNAWWSTGGTHGITVSSMQTTSYGTNNTIKVTGNLAFGNQSLVISHVFNKGFVDMKIDEGSAIHIQNEDNLFKKGILIDDNLMLYNGKAGINLNTVADPTFSSPYSPVTITNNSSYYDDRVVDGAEWILNKSVLASATGNLFHPRATRATLRDNSGNSFGANSNVTLSGIAGDSGLPSSFLKLSAVFTNPAAHDFTPASGVPSGMGVAPSTLSSLMDKVAEYGIALVEPPQVVDTAWMNNMKATIFATWPVSLNSIVLEDPVLGDYHYNQRCRYPNPPGSGPAC